ncbi:acyl carrier protein [Eubacterium sp.]|uniref:acyl carrier protein n=1 Tax=Eubacterium sp. TaxID=142586 RepID=UPI00352183B4
MSDVFEFVKETVDEILLMKGVEGIEISEDSKIVQDLGLKSLDIAQVLAMLEAEYDKDPFSNGTVTLSDVVTVGDLCKLYI